MRMTKSNRIESVYATKKSKLVDSSSQKKSFENEQSGTSYTSDGVEEDFEITHSSLFSNDVDDQTTM